MPEHQHSVFKILTLNHISALGLNRFPAGCYQVGNDMASYESHSGIERAKAEAKSWRTAVRDTAIDQRSGGGRAGI